jgi:hypothetical protein
MAAAVQYKNGVFQIGIKDVTTGKAFTHSSAVSGAMRSSAEFIVEAPEVCNATRCSLTPLSNFGTTVFGTDNTAIKMTCDVQVGPKMVPLGTFPSSEVFPITMVNQRNHAIVMSTPSAISSDGTSFSVTWGSYGP